MILRDGWKISSDTFAVPEWKSVSSASVLLTVQDEWSALDVSACGNFLAAATMNGHLAVWKISDRFLISKQQYKRLLLLSQRNNYSEREKQL